MFNPKQATDAFISKLNVYL